jgi:hypothetical protein
MNRYGPRAQRIMHKVMQEFEEGNLRSSRSHKKVTDHDQAVAIGLSKARKSGAKVPNERSED